MGRDKSRRIAPGLKGKDGERVVAVDVGGG